jgi:RHS repeat-associated protein
MKTILSSVGLAALLLFASALPTFAADPGDNSPSTGPSVEPQRPQTTPANTTATFYYWDHLGTVRMTAGENPTPETVERHDYEPYGLEMLPATNQASNTHQFTGHERDALGGGTGVAVDYMHFRYYGSNLGRFMKPDNGADQSPMNPQSWNLYSYVRGNPVNFNDPTGKWGSEIHNAIINAAFPGLTPEQKQVLKDISAKVDRGQTKAHNHDHSMRSPGEDPVAARAAIQSDIQKHEQAAKGAQGSELPKHSSDITNPALEEFGKAAHTIADSFSPTHTDQNGNPTEGAGIPTNLTEASNMESHLKGEETITRAQMSEAVAAERKAFESTFGFDALSEVKTRRKVAVLGK